VWDNVTRELHEIGLKFRMEWIWIAARRRRSRRVSLVVALPHTLSLLATVDSR
jgi:hypothetical protein